MKECSVCGILVKYYWIVKYGDHQKVDYLCDGCRDWTESFRERR